MFDPNESLNRMAAGDRKFMLEWNSSVTAAFSAGLLSPGALALAMVLVKHSDEWGRTVYASQTTLGGDSYQKRSVSKYLRELEGVGAIIQQRLDHRLESGKVPSRAQRAKKKLVDAWVRSPVPSHVNVPNLIGFRIPVELLRQMEGMVKQNGNPVIPHHENARERRALNRDHEHREGAEIQHQQNLHAEVSRIQSEMQAAGFNGDVHELIDESPAHLRVLVRHRIMTWLRAHAHLRIIKHLAAMTDWSDITEDQRYSPVLPWVEAFVRKRQA